MVETLGAELSAGAAVAEEGAALGGGALGGLPASWCCANTIEENNRAAAKERLESRIKHLLPAVQNRAWKELYLIGRQRPLKRIVRIVSKCVAIG